MSEAGRRARFYELTAKGAAGSKPRRSDGGRFPPPWRRCLRHGACGSNKEQRMGIWSRVTRTFRGDRHSAEIQEELEFHLDMDAAGGHDRREPALRLGNVTRIEEETRAVGIIEWLDSALQDARYGVRQMRRTPASDAGGGALAGHRHGREHGDLQPRRRGDPEAAAGEGSRLAASSSSGPTRDSRRGSRTTTATTGRSPEAGIRARRSPRTYTGASAREQTAFEPLDGNRRHPDAVAIASDASPPSRRDCNTSAATSSRASAPSP